MGLADAAGGLLAFLNLPDGASGTATIESKTNFFRAVRGGHVHGRTSVLHRAGRRSCSRPTSATTRSGTSRG